VFQVRFDVAGGSLTESQTQKPLAQLERFGQFFRIRDPLLGVGQII
jgi:hypothetical protein